MFGRLLWQLTTTATDANRCVIRLCRQLQRASVRPRVRVPLPRERGARAHRAGRRHGRPRSRPGNIGPPVDPVVTSKVVEYNDVAALEQALAREDAACVLMEPAMTNVGIVPPQPGYLEEVRRLCDETGTLLVNDETHTWCAGPGGCTAAWGLRPDIVTLGKTLASGIPIGAYGVSARVGRAYPRRPRGRLQRPGRHRRHARRQRARGSAAARATLTSVLTDEAFAHMTALAERFEDGVHEVIQSRRLPLVPRQAGRQGRVSLLRRGPAHRLGVVRRPGHGPQRVLPPLRPEPRDPHHALPQHGVDVPGDDDRRRGPALRGLRRGGGRTHRVKHHGERRLRYRIPAR